MEDQILFNWVNPVKIYLIFGLWNLFVFWCLLFGILDWVLSPGFTPPSL
jgi:hypothetical protein